jgi:hypothetical protein
LWTIEVAAKVVINPIRAKENAKKNAVGKEKALLMGVGRAIE